MAALRAQAAAKWQAGRYSSVRFFFLVERHWFFLDARDRSIVFFFFRSRGFFFPFLAPSNCTFLLFPKGRGD